MRFLCFILFCTTFFFQFFAQEDSPIQTNEKDSTEEYQIKRGADIPGSKYCDACIIEEGQIVNDRKHGLWLKYYESGTLKSKITYLNNRPNGPYESYYENGQVKESGDFSRNKYHGYLIRFYSSGCIQYSGWYNDFGKEDGEVNFYFDDCDSSNYPFGQTEFSYETKNGIPMDTAYRYYPNGDLHEMIVYDINAHRICNPATYCN